MRVKDTDDQTAWEEFAAIYRPVICRFARKRGLQESDAQDLAQNVLAAVAAAIPDWQPDESNARFRTWLSRIAFNQTVTIFRRRRTDRARGSVECVEELCDHQGDITALQVDYQREVFRSLARRVREEVEETTWQAFWMTAVEGCSISDVAESLGRSTGSVYTARSRILRRLRQLAAEFDEDARI